MSVGVAWFPDFGHIVAGIFLLSLIINLAQLVSPSVALPAELVSNTDQQKLRLGLS